MCLPLCATCRSAALEEGARPGEARGQFSARVEHDTWPSGGGVSTSAWARRGVDGGLGSASLAEFESPAAVVPRRTQAMER